MGYNKANLLVERALSYDVVLGDQPQAALAASYHHAGPPSEEPCFQGVADEYEQAADYLAIADQCYWNFLRVLAPAGSQLVESSRHVVPGDTLFSGRTWDSAAQTLNEFPPLTTFANFLLVPRGEEITAAFRYALPPGVVETGANGSVYRLTIYKQPGARSEPLRATITLPDGATLLEAVPSPGESDGNRLTYEINLDANLEITLRYR
jgi:hypothetical protein